MSDISIRLDGLLLGAALALAAAIYLSLAIGFGLGALLSPSRRGHLATVARVGAGFGVVSLIALGLAAAYIDRRGTAATGADWIDWLTVPVLVLFVLGCRQLARVRSG